MRIGYARVSSNTQDYQAQVEGLKAAACGKIYSEKVSGKSTDNRHEFKKLMKVLVPGDVVVITRLDRLARSTRDLLNIVHDLQEKGCGFVSLGESWCDTSSDIGRLMVTVMAGIAEFERGLIRKRCEEGIGRAKAKGTKFGRHNALDPGQRRKVAERRARGATVRQLADDYGVGVATIMRALG